MKARLLSVFTAVLLFGQPIAVTAQGPDIGTCASFVFFTAAGDLANTGPSIMTGDIGTNLGAITGFLPGILLGTMHVEDGTSAQAALDVIAVYDEITAIPCDSVLATTLGTGQILTPYVYCLTAASTLDGDLVLDGEGDPDALFVFKIEGAFATTALSTVALINGASECNVYWQVSGAYSQGVTSLFQGRIVGNGALSFADGSRLLGNGLTRQGLISTDSMQADICSPGVFAVTFSGLDAVVHGNLAMVDLVWNTASESNSSVFHVERSQDGAHFMPIGAVSAAGVSAERRRYRFVDQYPMAGMLYYRIKAIDLDGKQTYSSIRAIPFDYASISARVFPNPFQAGLMVDITGAAASAHCAISIYNTHGTLVLRKDIVRQQTDITTETLAPGIYYYKLVVDAVVIQSGKLIRLR